MRNSRTYQDGINNVNGFVVNVVRFVGAQQVSETSRLAARHWGTITTPDGNEISMGDNGMTTPDINKIVGKVGRFYNRSGVSGESSELKKLKSAMDTMSAMGLDTSAIAEKIAELEAQAAADKADAERRKREQSAEYKRIKKQVKELEKSRETLSLMGLDTASIDEKIYELKAQLI